MKLGISGQIFYNSKTTEEVFEKLHTLGADGIELWFNNTPKIYDGKNEMDSLLTDESLEEIAVLSRRYGIAVACVTHAEQHNNPDDYASSLSRAVEAAKHLGAQCVNHYIPVGLRDEYDAETLAKKAMPYFNKAIKKAESLCIPLALENEAYDITCCADGTLTLLKVIDSPYFKTNYDAANYYHGGDEPFPYAYDVLQPYIAYVHIKNGCLFNELAGHQEIDKGGECTGRLAGKYMYYPTADMGVVNVSAIITRLSRDDYDGYVTIEPHVRPERLDAYLEYETKYLRSLGVGGQI